MKNILYILYILLMGCTTTEHNTDYLKMLNVIKLSGENKYNRKLTTEDESDLVEFRKLALEASDIISYVNVYNYSSLLINDNKKVAFSKAKTIFDSTWNIQSKYEYLSRLNDIYFTGLRSTYIKALNLLLSKEELLGNPDKLLERKTWEDKLNSGLMSEDDYFLINFLIINGEKVSYKDVELFELERASFFIRLGYALHYLSYTESCNLLEDLAIHMLDYDYNWYDWGNSYISGLYLLFNTSQNLEKTIRHRSLSIQDILAHYSWSKSSWDNYREQLKQLREKRIIKSPEYFNYSLKLPKLPGNIEIADNIKLLFSPERISKDMILKYTLDFNLYNSIENNNYQNVKKILSQHAYDDFNDIQLPSGISYISEAVYEKDNRILKLLLETGFNADLQNTGNKLSPLHTAIKEGDNEKLFMLLDSITNIDSLTGARETPLCIAIKTQNEIAVKVLLNAGANPNIGYVGRYSPLESALILENSNIGKIVYKASDPNRISDVSRYNILSEYIKNNRQFEFKDLIKVLKNTSYRTENGENLLYMVFGNKDYYWAINTLVESGYSLNLPGYNNYSILSLLASLKEFEMILWVIDHGFDLNIPDKHAGLPVLKQVLKLVDDKKDINFLKFIQDLKDRGYN